MKPTDVYIDGVWQTPHSGRIIEVINPSTGQVVTQVSVSDQVDINRAVSAARRAAASFGAWSTGDKKALLQSVLAEYTNRAGDLARAMSEEMGAPIDFAARDHAGSGAWHLGGFIEAIGKVDFDSPLDHDPAHRVIRRPVGVAALITPWNWPMNQLVIKVGAALAAGCSMVAKPAESAPMSSMVFAEVLDAAGVPPGVFNLVNGGAAVGALLSTHREIDMVSFTGSTRAGISIATEAAKTGKRVALELGGKSPTLIFADTDVERAVRRTADLAFENTGQSCNSPSRMLVEASKFKDAVEIAADVAATTAVAPADQPGPHIGPLANAHQYRKVRELIQAGLGEGATLVSGGLSDPLPGINGFFVAPTVFSDVEPGMRISREEIFGPVLTITPFASEQEAVEMANDTEYGLSAYVHTASVERAERLARTLNAGMIQYNGTSLARGAPFGGIKMSGCGREGGRFGIEEFLEVISLSGLPQDTASA